MKKEALTAVPVLIIGYARVQQISNMISKLQSFGFTKIFLAIDYSQDAVIQSHQRELLDLINHNHAKGLPKVEVWMRGKKHGIAVGVITAIDWFFSMNELGIILEDDLEFNEDFLQFCTRGLEYYAKQNDVILISGNRFNESELHKSISATNYPQIWGWATWRNRWKVIYDWILSEKTIKVRDLANVSTVFFYAGAKRAQLGLVDTWDLPFAYEMRKSRSLCILPPVNLVKNVGADVHAAHTKDAVFPMNFPIRDLPPFRFLPIAEFIKEVEVTNAFLEKRVFKVRLRNLLSILKVKFQLRGWSIGEYSIDTLTNRLMEAEKYE